jgi:signal transduction histidine kinase
VDAIHSWYTVDVARSKYILFYLLSLLVLLAVAIRGLGFYVLANHPARSIAAVLLLAFAILMVVEPWLRMRTPWLVHLYLALQTGLLLVLLLLPPHQDFFAALWLPLSAQAMLVLPRPTSFRWIGIFTLVMAIGLVTTHDVRDALGLLLLYGAGYVFVAAYAYITTQAEATRAESQRLLAELQAAHRQLQEYAAQAEEVAAADERNRLARELHDSLTQTLYSLTLQAEAASRELAAGETRQANEQLQTIRRTAQQALGEMRALLFELRPPDLEAEGLVAALQERLEAVEARTGLVAELIVEGEETFPQDVEPELYRIAQEALNNVLKHAQAHAITLSLHQANGAIVLEVADDGRGFAMTTSQPRSGMGLRSMEERAAQLGGTLTVRSVPGGGTRVRVEVPR